MYKVPKMTVSQLKGNPTKEGEPIEHKIERVVSNKEPIKDGAPIIWTPRDEGVRPSTDIRTDRFEIALQATETIAKSYTARREELKEQRKNESAKAESIGGKVETTATSSNTVS